MSNMLEVYFRKDGKILKRICFSQQGNGNGTIYVVWAQDMVYDLGPVTSSKWANYYISQFSNREYAKTTYLGLISKAAQEEGGSNDLILEEAEKAMYRSVSSIIGKL